MTSELLRKEEEFHKLNNELENKAKKLKEEANVVMDNICRDVIPQSLPKFNFAVKHSMKVSIDHTERPSSVNPRVLCDNRELDDLPDCVNEMGLKGMNRFFRARIKKTQMDYEKLQSEYKVKCDELKKVQQEVQKIEEEKEKWFHISAGHKTQIGKLENHVSSLSSKLQSKEGENLSLRKENDQLQKDLKNATLAVSNLENKLKKISEEYEKAKACLKNTKQEEKDLRESHRKQISEMSNIIKRIEKHKIELLNGFKKQLLLIDNLKKQKAHIECYKLCEKADADFMKSLDWKTDQ